MKIYERLAQAFVGEGVTTVFGMMGDGNMHWMDALDTLGVKLLEVRHEGVACGMADGWARATRTPGVCTATCGPGVSQLGTALLTASRASSPLVAFVGEAPTVDSANSQRLDQPRFAAAVEAGYVHVAGAETVDEAVRTAFYLAKIESRPVLLGAAMDIQQRAFEDADEPYRPSPKLPTAHAQPVQADSDTLRQAADIIAASRRPVILVGRGAMWAGAEDAVLKLSQRIGALVATTLRAKTWLSDHEYHAGVAGNFSTRTAMELFQETDCVIAVGASMTRYSTLQGYLFPKARYVHVDVKPYVMMEAGLAADCYVQSDARTGLQALERLLADRSLKSTGYRTPDVKQRLARQYEDSAEFMVEPGCVDPRDVCRALDAMMPTDIALLTGSGSNACFSAMLFNRPRPLMLSALFFGCIGQMFPAAMGAIVATGNRPALLVDGDASIIMHLSDFETAVRYDMPLLIVVMNDQALGAEYHKMRAHKLKAELSTIPTPDLGNVARALGGNGRLVRSIDELRAAATEWLDKPEPTILDVRISKNVLSIPYRRTHYGQDA